MEVPMSDLFWLTEAQMERLRPFFPLPHGVPRVDDRRVLSGIIFVNRNGLRWRDAPAEYGPYASSLVKRLYQENRINGRTQFFVRGKMQEWIKNIVQSLPGKKEPW